MQTSMVFSALLVALCCVHYVSASGYGVDCACACCIPSKRNACRAFDLGSVHLDIPSCDIPQCLSACRKQYPLCESGKSIMQATCSGSEPSSTVTTIGPSLTSTASPSTSMSTAAPSSSSSTMTSSSATSSKTTPTAPWSTTTSQGSSTMTDSTASQGSTPSTKPMTSSASMASSTTSTQPMSSTSSASAIKSFCQFSYSIVFAVVMTCLYM